MVKKVKLRIAFLLALILSIILSLFLVSIFRKRCGIFLSPTDIKNLEEIEKKLE